MPTPMDNFCDGLRLIEAVAAIKDAADNQNENAMESVSLTVRHWAMLLEIIHNAEAGDENTGATL